QSNLVTLGTPAKLAVTLDAKRSVVDFGEADYFTCTPTGGASPFHYEWDVAGTGNVSGNASESVEIGALGPVTVTCWVTDAEPKVSGRSVSVQINPTLVVIDDANRTAADAGQSVQFECSVTGGSEPYSLGWSFGDGGTSALSTVSYSYSAAGDYAPACSVTDAAGVTSAPAMTIAVSPRLDVRANVTSTAVAPGTPLAFSATATNGTGDYTSFTWSFGSGATVSGQDVSHTFTSAGDVSISVGVVDSNGATATSVVSVDVSPIRMAASPSTTSLTVQGSVTFTATAAGGAGGPYNYTWNFGDGSVGWGASVTHQYSTIGTMDPTLTVTDHLGATNTTTLPSIAVSAAKPPNSWATGWFALAVALLIGAIIAIVVLARRRKSEAKEAQSASSAYVPPTDPKKTIRGAKLCEFCGASNLPIRTTCSSCGKPLPRAPVS
ncbi:MAG: PKD domain-containing protein, partial [Thermoplasmata archaeon]